MPFKAPAFLFNLDKDVVESLHSPPSRGAVSQPLVQVAPLNHHDGAVALAYSLNVTLQIAVKAPRQAAARARETERQMRLNKGLEMQGHEAAEQMDPHLPLSARPAENLQRFAKTHF
jgi:hypothetical protein